MQPYLRVSATVFGLIALGHLLRLLRHWPAEIAGWIVPALDFDPCARDRRLSHVLGAAPTTSAAGFLSGVKSCAAG
jgi:hypothetical protein